MVRARIGDIKVVCDWVVHNPMRVDPLVILGGCIRSHILCAPRCEGAATTAATPPPPPPPHSSPPTQSTPPPPRRKPSRLAERKGEEFAANSDTQKTGSEKLCYLLGSFA